MVGENAGRLLKPPNKPTAVFLCSPESLQNPIEFTIEFQSRAATFKTSPNKSIRNPPSCRVASPDPAGDLLSLPVQVTTLGKACQAFLSCFLLLPTLRTPIIGKGDPMCAVSSVRPTLRPAGESALCLQGKSPSIFLPSVRIERVSTLDC